MAMNSAVAGRSVSILDSIAGGGAIQLCRALPVTAHLGWLEAGLSVVVAFVAGAALSAFIRALVTRVGPKGRVARFLGPVVCIGLAAALFTAAAVLKTPSATGSVVANSSEGVPTIRGTRASMATGQTVQKSPAEADRKYIAAVGGIDELWCGALVVTEGLEQVEEPKRDRAVAWVAGYLTARNEFGHQKALTVGTSSSRATLGSMLWDICATSPVATPLWVVADKVYDRMEKGGM